MGATVTRNGKTYYKGDDGKLYANYNAARVAAEDRRNAGALQGLQDFFKRDRQSGYVGAVFPDPRRGVSGLSADPRVHNKPLSEDQLEALSKGQNEAITAYGSIPGSSLPPAPGLGAPDAYGDPAARAREAEQRRMMQQYASKEYWDTEQGKAMKDLAMQDRYEGKDLAKFYQAQQAVGTGSIDEIVSAMGYTGDMEKWARANKGLALREYLKKNPKGFSNDPAIAALPQGYENNLKTYEAHGAPQISVDQLMQAQVEQARQKGFNDEQILAQLKAPQMGLPIGNEAGAIAVVNREKMQQLQAFVPQAAATGAGEGAFNMQPQSAGTVDTAFAQPQPLVPGNIPQSPEMSGTEAEHANQLAQAFKKRIQGGF